MNQTVEKERLRRRKQNQRRARTKRFFMVLGVLVVALAAFLITVKICKPDFDFSLLVPDKAVTFAGECAGSHHHGAHYAGTYCAAYYGETDLRRLQGCLRFCV